MKNILFILGQLTDRDVEWLASRGTPRRVPTGTQLFQEGQPLESVFLVLEGRFSVHAAGASRLGVTGVGEMLGEMSFIDAAAPSADVTAQEECLVLAIPRKDLQAHLDSDDGFAARFYRAIAMMLSDRLRGMDTGARGLPRKQGVLEPDELDPNVLDSASRADERFDWMMQRFKRFKGDRPEG